MRAHPVDLSQDPRGRAVWTDAERTVFEALDTPEKVQAWLDDIAYNPDGEAWSPRVVLRKRTGHCVEGALLAAAALRYHGFGCRLLDLAAVRDDDHVLALYGGPGAWGAVSKSNCAGLRFREPIYRTVRELVMSYFELYFNVDGEKTLRACSRVLDMRRYDRHGWMTSEAPVTWVGDVLTDIAHQRLMTPAQEAALRPVDARTFAAGMLGADEAGLYRPDQHPA